MSTPTADQPAAMPKIATPCRQAGILTPSPVSLGGQRLPGASRAVPEPAAKPGKGGVYGTLAQNAGLPPGTWQCFCPSPAFHGAKVAECRTCGQLRPVSQSEQARAALADAQKPVEGWDAAAFEGPLINPYPGNERDLQAVCELELTRRGIWYLHLSPRAREKEGAPDLLFFHAGFGWGIELKNAKGQPSAAQRAALVAIRRNGGVARICRSLDSFRAVIDRKDTP